MFMRFWNIRLVGLLGIALLVSACTAAPLPSPATATPALTSTTGSPAATAVPTLPLATAEPATNAAATTPQANAQPPKAQLMPARVELPALPGLTPAPLLDAETAGKAIDDLLSKYEKVTALDTVIDVEVGGKTALAKAYGHADSQQDKVMTLDSRFRIFQLSGSFTAAAVLMLQEQGKLKVEDAVCNYVPDCPPAWHDLTIRHLLTHTSGLRDYAQLPGASSWQKYDPVPLIEMVKRTWDLPLTMTPGSDWQYSASDLMLASYIIEEASGMSYEAYLKQAVLDPLGLKDTGLSNPGPGLVAGNPGAAPRGVMENNYGAMGLYSTAGDLARWARALMSQGALPEQVRRQMLADQVHLGPDLQGDGWYGYSIIGHVNRGYMEWGDNASGPGFRGTLYFEPDSQLVVVMLVNTESVDHIAIIRALEKRLLSK